VLWIPCLRLFQRLPPLGVPDCFSLFSGRNVLGRSFVFFSYSFLFFFFFSSEIDAPTVPYPFFTHCHALGTLFSDQEAPWLTGTRPGLTSPQVFNPPSFLSVFDSPTRVLPLYPPFPHCLLGQLGIALAGAPIVFSPVRRILGFGQGHSVAVTGFFFVYLGAHAFGSTFRCRALFYGGQFQEPFRRVGAVFFQLGAVF